jgi:hypothetical protein
LRPWDAVQVGQRLCTLHFVGVTHPAADGTRQRRGLRCAAGPLIPQRLERTLGSSAGLSRNQDSIGHRGFIWDALTRIALSSVYHPILSFFGVPHSLHGAWISGSPPNETPSFCAAMLIIVFDWRIRSSTVRAMGPTLPCLGYPPSIGRGVRAQPDPTLMPSKPLTVRI